MNLSDSLSLIAALITLVVFVWYNWGIIKGSVEPVIVSWCLWSTITIIGVTSFQLMASSFPKAFAMAADCSCGALTTIGILARNYPKGVSVKKFLLNLWQAMGLWEKWATLTGLLSIVAGVIFRSATVANSILLCGYSAAFIPTYARIRQDPKAEKAAPWFVWSAAFLMAEAGVIAKADWKWPELIPYGVYVLLHFRVGWLARKGAQKFKTIQ